jgi:hypothetical protein
MSETSGSGNVVVKVDDLGAGWVCIHLAEGVPEPGHLPRVLQDALQRWCQARPHCRIRAALPIQVQGSTCAIHLWWDIVSKAAGVLRQPQGSNAKRGPDSNLDCQSRLFVVEGSSCQGSGRSSKGRQHGHWEAPPCVGRPLETYEPTPGTPVCEAGLPAQNLNSIPKFSPWAKKSVWWNEKMGRMMGTPGTGPARLGISVGLSVRSICCPGRATSLQ